MFDFSSFEAHKGLGDFSNIHPTALVSHGAKLDSSVTVGPNAIIGPNVSLAKDVQIGAGAIVSGHTTIGEGTRVFPYATVGTDPQDLKYDGEETQLVIGKNNNIREYVNISCGTSGGGGKTSIGDNNLIMAYTHVGHDCYIGNHCIFANSVQLAGHVIIGDYVVFGGLAGAHQFTRFGDRAMVAAGAVVVQDVAPFCMVQGDRATITGLNVVGLRRSGLKRENISEIKSMFRMLFNDNLTLDDAMTKIQSEIADSSEKETFLNFLRSSERGVCR